MHIGTKITDIECGLKKSWFKGGRLWIFAGHMCFYSLMFGSEQKILIKNEGIRDVKVLKAKTAAKSSIDIGTKTGRCCLTSFKSKDGFEKCMRLIRNIIAQYHPNSESNSNINDQSLDHHDAEQQRQHRFKQSFSALNGMSPPLRSHHDQQQSEPISPLQHGHMHHRARSQSIAIGTSHDKGTIYGKHRSATLGEPLMLQLNNQTMQTASIKSTIMENHYKVDETDAHLNLDISAREQNMSQFSKLSIIDGIDEAIAHMIQIEQILDDNSDNNGKRKIKNHVSLVKNKLSDTRGKCTNYNMLHELKDIKTQSTLDNGNDTDRYGYDNLKLKLKKLSEKIKNSGKDRRSLSLLVELEKLEQDAKIQHQKIEVHIFILIFFFVNKCKS